MPVNTCATQCHAYHIWQSTRVGVIVKNACSYIRKYLPYELSHPFIPVSMYVNTHSTCDIKSKCASEFNPIFSKF